MSADLLVSADPLLPILLEECERIIQESLESAMQLDHEQIESIIGDDSRMILSEHSPMPEDVPAA